MTEIYMGAAQRGSEDTSAFNSRVTALEDQNGSATLTTTAQTLSGAVNELDNDLGEAETLLGSETLTTTSQTVTGAINELDDDIGTLETLAGDTELPTTAQTLTGAIDELHTNVAQCAIDIPNYYHYCRREGYVEITRTCITGNAGICYIHRVRMRHCPLHTRPIR